jgi:hypothetical protein
VVTVLCLQFVLGGKTYYPGGGYPFLFAAGAAAPSAAAPACCRCAAGSRWTAWPR